MSALEPGPFAAADAERVELVGVDGATVPAIHAAPREGARRGLVLHPDLMGIRPLFDDLAWRLATHGFAVCSPEPFARAGADVLASADAAPRFAVIPTLDDAIQMGDLVAAADYVVAHDGVTEVAVTGFCMGGMQVLKAAALGRFTRAVMFYGMIAVPTDWAGPRLRDPLAEAAAGCPTLAILGGVDPYTPDADVAALRAVWKARPECEIVVYPEADHGFVHDASRPAHRSDDAADAWRRTLAFLSA
jgi:carboxymethylenebutenolidase